MALFDKLFSTKRKLDDGNIESRDCSSHEIALEQVRLLLFKECDWRGHKLLFDSSSIECVPTSKDGRPVPTSKDGRPVPKQFAETSNVIEMSDGVAYVYKGPSQDAGTLSEMIFGAVAMNYKGVSLKIHILDDPQRLMCTKVFCVPANKRMCKAECKASDTSQDAVVPSEADLSPSTPLSMPLHRSEEDMSLNFSFDKKDSGFYAEHSPVSSVSSAGDYLSMLGICDVDCQDVYSFHSPAGRKLSTGSNGSWQRRTFRNLSTRFDLGQSTNMLTVPSGATNFPSFESQMYSSSEASGTSDSLSSTASSGGCLRRTRLGLALLITVTDSTQMDLVRHCAEHSPQLQTLLCRLRAATLLAGSGPSFVSTLHQATVAAARWLSDLVYGPRIPSAWLSLVAGQPPSRQKLADSLVTDLCSVLAAADTKHTNFFISTLLTHVLTYHLGWVTTVSPYDISIETKKPNPDVNRSYNALWAQLEDLCGNIGYPPTAARTIIYGNNNQQFLKKLLVVLTYFIRCGEVKRSDFNFHYNESPAQIISFIDSTSKKPKSSGLKRTTTCANKLDDKNSDLCNFTLPSVNTLSSDSAFVTSHVYNKLGKLGEKLSSSVLNQEECYLANEVPMTSQMKRTSTVMIPMLSSSESSLSSTDGAEGNDKVIFVLGDDDKLVGLKNKSTGGRSVKKTAKVAHEPSPLVLPKGDVSDGCDERQIDNPSICCGQQSQHSKPIKHSGFKFEFDKYPQIVTNYMKSKNLEILDRHYIGKPGNLKLDNFQFDPTVVPPLTEERCEICYKCQLLESTLQTPTNASELEYMNDGPRHAEPQYATVIDADAPLKTNKNFVKKTKENTVVVNIIKPNSVGTLANNAISNSEYRKLGLRTVEEEVAVTKVIEIPMVHVDRSEGLKRRSGFDKSLLGGVTSHYVPDFILQGTLADPEEWDKELKRDLNISAYLNKSMDAPVQAVAIVGDTSKWQVCVRCCGRGAAAAGMSALVGAMLDALPHMRRASLPAAHCLSFIEGKLREFCVLSKTLADMLMSTDFCDMATLTKSLNIDVNDVPLLLAVASTHTPQVAARYGISYR